MQNSRAQHQKKKSSHQESESIHKGRAEMILQLERGIRMQIINRRIVQYQQDRRSIRRSQHSSEAHILLYRLCRISALLLKCNH
jgi:hypothetical protein